MKLQAEYDAEQESKFKLQEDIAALRTSYETRLSSLERSRASRTHTTGNVETTVSFRSIFRFYIFLIWSNLLVTGGSCVDQHKEEPITAPVASQEQANDDHNVPELL